MARILPGPVRGAIVFSALLALLGFWGVVFFPVAMPALVPSKEIRRSTRRRLRWILERWSFGNLWILRLMTHARWEIDGLDSLRRDGRYLIVANHRSWLDVFTIFGALVERISTIQFFVKHQVIWVPIAGQACWCLGFPFMKRYPKEFLAKHPELRGKDFETTRDSLRKLGDDPASMVNFMEGTRFTPAKRDAQQSPYRHLLKPKSGGVAFVLGSIGERIDAILDLTIVYPRGGRTFWHFICDRVPWVHVHVEPRPVPAEFATEATFQDRAVRERFRQWVRKIWLEKDERITSVLAGHGIDPVAADEAA